MAETELSGPEFYKGKSVLVAGGTGTIGVPLVSSLVESGADITVVSLDEPERVRSIFGDDIQYVKADLREFDACLKATENQEIVFNMVAIKGSVGIGTSRAASYYVPMLLFNTNMMEAAFRNKVSRYLFVSSVCAYPQSEMHFEDNMWNGFPEQGDKYAGIAKRAGEVQAQTYLDEYGWDAVRIVRPANVYGPHDDFNPLTAQVIPSLIRRMLDGENPTVIWGDGSVIRDFIYSEDVADGMLVATANAPACVPINLGSGSATTIKMLAETIAKLVPDRPEIQWDASGPTGDPVRLLSTDRAKSLIGFNAPTNLESGIRRTIDWYADNRTIAATRTSGLEPSSRS